MVQTVVVSVIKIISRLSLSAVQLSHDERNKQPPNLTDMFKLGRYMQPATGPYTMCFG